MLTSEQFESLSNDAHAFKIQNSCFVFGFVNDNVKKRLWNHCLSLNIVSLLVFLKFIYMILDPKDIALCLCDVLQYCRSYNHILYNYKVVIYSFSVSKHIK